MSQLQFFQTIRRSILTFFLENDYYSLKWNNLIRIIWGFFFNLNNSQEGYFVLYYCPAVCHNIHICILGMFSKCIFSCISALIFCIGIFFILVLNSWLLPNYWIFVSIQWVLGPQSVVLTLMEYVCLWRSSSNVAHERMKHPCYLGMCGLLNFYLGNEFKNNWFMPFTTWFISLPIKTPWNHKCTPVLSVVWVDTLLLGWGLSSDTWQCVLPSDNLDYLNWHRQLPSSEFYKNWWRRATRLYSFLLNIQ